MSVGKDKDKMTPGQKGVCAVPSLLAAILAEVKSGQAKLLAGQTAMLAKLNAGQAEMCCGLCSAVERGSGERCEVGVPCVTGSLTCL